MSKVLWVQEVEGMEKQVPGPEHRRKLYASLRRVF